ncbi:DnaD domain protein [Paenibacillus filicis]|uniref:DnaD domain protein n=1 Tax=Paenibacillus gyeongsangnamensis TaxID=3388067 RepID=A0ABT4Q336_9BACL|nr:DnaD domain protein [Paenibacillus filicis]MCZ8511287.1 DnaD domain protein [Paenibacillus filicis]
MRRNVSTDELSSVLLTGWQDGHVDVPYWLLRYYTRVGMNELDVMLALHVMAYQQKECKDFPTLEELQQRMSVNQERIIAVLQKLLKAGLVAIDEHDDPATGVHGEKYNWKPLMDRLAACRLEELRLERESEELNRKSGEAQRRDIFTIFEKEFGRPLTPMELESISGWLDKDGYAEELILAGLKEAVFAGKVHFRYIDRILLEWQRNRVQTVEQAKEHSQRFRSMR